MDDAELEVLVERGAQYLQVLGVLACGDVAEAEGCRCCCFCGGHIGRAGKVGVVLDVFYSSIKTAAIVKHGYAAFSCNF